MTEVEIKLFRKSGESRSGCLDVELVPSASGSLLENEDDKHSSREDSSFPGTSGGECTPERLMEQILEPVYVRTFVEGDDHSEEAMELDEEHPDMSLTEQVIQVSLPFSPP